MTNEDLGKLLSHHAELMVAHQSGELTGYEEQIHNDMLDMAREIQRLLRLESVCREVYKAHYPNLLISEALERLDKERALNTGKPLEQAHKNAVPKIYGCDRGQIDEAVK